jgi:hypothetical protein
MVGLALQLDHPITASYQRRNGLTNTYAANKPAPTATSAKEKDAPSPLTRKQDEQQSREPCGPETGDCPAVRHDPF